MHVFKDVINVFKMGKLNYVSQDAALGHKTIQKRKVIITIKVRTVVNLGGRQ